MKARFIICLAGAIGESHVFWDGPLRSASKLASGSK